MQGPQRDGSRAWIEGVPTEEIGSGWDMLLRGVLSLLRHRGETTDLSELMALSGDAFNLCFASHWQATAYLAAPTDTLSNVADSFGYAHRWLLPLPDHRMRALPEAERRRVTDPVLQQIEDEIDAGRPVLVGGCADRGCGPWSIVAGYDSAEPALCHVGLGEPYRWTGIRGLTIQDEVSGYWNGRVRGAVRPGFVGGPMADPAFMLLAARTRPSARRRAVDALRRAVRAFNAPYHRVEQWGGVTYYFGRRAYEEWARELRELDYPADLHKPRPADAYGWYDMDTMDVLVDCIVRGRRAAANFCDGMADLLGNAKPNLLAAARFYRREVAIAEQAFDAFLSGDAAERSAWLSSPQKREAGARAVMGMLQDERAAVREIELALQLEQPEVPAAFTHAPEPLARARKQPFGPGRRRQKVKEEEED